MPEIKLHRRNEDARSLSLRAGRSFARPLTGLLTAAQRVEIGFPVHPA